MNYKKDFPIIKNISYLDSAATSQKPKFVIDAIAGFYNKENANIHRGLYDLAEKATIRYENARENIAAFFGAETKNVIFTSGTTESINMVASSYDIREGDEILTTIMEHHANIIPWQELAAKRKAILKFAPIKKGMLDLEAFRRLITKKTKLVTVTHISNVLGTANPIIELAVMAHEAGAKILVDAAQSAGHYPIRIGSGKEKIDFLAFSGHKMFGPTGIGVLITEEPMRPYKYGGGMIKEVTTRRALWADPPQKYEAGTPNIAGAVGLSAAIDYIKSIGIDNIREHEKRLAFKAWTDLKKIDFVRLYGPSPENNPDRAAVISFSIEGVHPHDVAQILNDNGVAIRTGHHCAQPLMTELGVKALCRASFTIYNDENDIRKLILTLKKVKEVFR